MRTGVTLAEIRTEALIEAGFSTDGGHQAFSKDRLNQLIRRHERMLASEHDWPGMIYEETVTVAANARYADLPAEITSPQVTTVHVRFGSDWLLVPYGIDARHQSIYGTDERVVPIMRWQVVAPGTTEFEVWPIGNVAQTLLFRGQKAVGTMKEDDDTCTLDADVIVLRVAAEILGRDQKADAALKLEAARNLINNILKNAGTTRRATSFSGGEEVRLRPGIDYIPPAGGS